MSALSALIHGVNRLVGLYGLILILYILSSWLPQLRDSSVGRILARLSEPYLGLFRGIIPLLGAIDFSPMLGFLVLRLIQVILSQAQGALP